MYRPNIKDEQIEALRVLRKETKTPITKMVEQAISSFLKSQPVKNGQVVKTAEKVKKS